LTLAATLAASHNRVRSWHDAESGRTYRDVPPVLTPALVAGQQLTWRVHRAVALTADGRYQSRQQLDLSAARMRSAPAFFVLDGGARVQVRRHALLVQGRNLLDRLAFTAGDVSDGVPRYFVLAPRSVEVTARVTF
jgi:outer membrane receptor protein involved in Fe transport